MIFRLQVCMLQRRLMQSRGTAGCSSCPIAARRTQIAPRCSASAEKSCARCVRPGGAVRRNMNNGFVVDGT